MKPETEAFLFKKVFIGSRPNVTNSEMAVNSLGIGIFSGGVIETAIGLQPPGVISLALGGAAMVGARLHYRRNQQRLERAFEQDLQDNIWHFEDPQDGPPDNPGEN